MPDKGVTGVTNQPELYPYLVIYESDSDKQGEEGGTAGLVMTGLTYSSG